jgi:hypothetical protein
LFNGDRLRHLSQPHALDGCAKHGSRSRDDVMVFRFGARSSFWS